MAETGKKKTKGRVEKILEPKKPRGSKQKDQADELMELTAYYYLINGRNKAGAKAYNMALQDMGRQPIKPRCASVQTCRYKDDPRWQKAIERWEKVLAETLEGDAREWFNKRVIEAITFNVADYFREDGSFDFEALKEAGISAAAISKIDVTFYPDEDAGLNGPPPIKRVTVEKANAVNALTLMAKVSGFDAPTKIEHSAEAAIVEWLNAPLPKDPVPEENSGGD